MHIVKAFKENGEICGIKLPEGIKESEKFAEVLFTPSTKADLGNHDENISFEKTIEILGKGLAKK